MVGFFIGRLIDRLLQFSPSQNDWKINKIYFFFGKKRNKLNEWGEETREFSGRGGGRVILEEKEEEKEEKEDFWVCGTRFFVVDVVVDVAVVVVSFVWGWIFFWKLWWSPRKSQIFLDSSFKKLQWEIVTNIGIKRKE